MESVNVQVVETQVVMLESIGVTEITDDPAYSLEQDGRPLPYLPFLQRYPAWHVLSMLPYELAYRYCCVPIGIEEEGITLATCQRIEREVLNYFCEIVQKAIFQVRCEDEIIRDILRYWRYSERAIEQ